MIALFFLILFCLLLYTSLVSLAQIKSGSEGPKFSLPNLDGEIIEFNDYKNRQDLLILCFIDGVDLSTQFAEELEGFLIQCNPKKTYQLIIIDGARYTKQSEYEDSLLLANQYWRDKSTQSEVLLDEDSKITELYEVNQLPAVLLFDRDLKIKKIYSNLKSFHKNRLFQYFNFYLGCQKDNKSAVESCNGGPCGPTTIKNINE
jgi:hypothetical protein